MAKFPRKVMKGKDCRGWLEECGVGISPLSQILNQSTHTKNHCQEREF